MWPFGKKESCCSGGCQSQAENNENAMVKILGGGCSSCNELETNTVEALKTLGWDTSIDHVTDFVKIAAYGVMRTPALVYDGKVLSYGTVLSTKDIIALLEKSV